MGAWRYELPEKHADFLRRCIDEGYIEGVATAVKVALGWIQHTVRASDISYRLDEILDEVECVDDESTEEDIDYILSEFYDLCDDYMIWIPI